MGPTWVLSAPAGPHVGPMNLAIRVALMHKKNWYLELPVITIGCNLISLVDIQCCFGTGAKAIDRIHKVPVGVGVDYGLNACLMSIARKH